MYQDDFLLRHIASLIALIVAIIRGERPDEALDPQLQSVFGLSLGTIDALSAEALVGLVPPEDPRGPARLEGLASVLDAFAAQELDSALSRQRRAKAVRIRELLTGQ